MPFERPAIGAVPEARPRREMLALAGLLSLATQACAPLFEEPGNMAEQPRTEEYAVSIARMERRIAAEKAQQRAVDEANEAHAKDRAEYLADIEAFTAADGKIDFAKSRTRFAQMYEGSDPGNKEGIMIANAIMYKGALSGEQSEKILRGWETGARTPLFDGRTGLTDAEKIHQQEGLYAVLPPALLSSDHLRKISILPAPPQNEEDVCTYQPLTREIACHALSAVDPETSVIDGVVAASAPIFLPLTTQQRVEIWSMFSSSMMHIRERGVSPTHLQSKTDQKLHGKAALQEDVAAWTFFVREALKQAPGGLFKVKQRGPLVLMDIDDAYAETLKDLGLTTNEVKEIVEAVEAYFAVVDSKAGSLSRARAELEKAFIEAMSKPDKK